MRKPLDRAAGSFFFDGIQSRIVEVLTLHDEHRTGWQQRTFDDVLEDPSQLFVGEFAVGFNPLILHPMKDTLFDEKIAGSIHFTPGQAYEEADNGNRSDVHWDMVMIQTPGYGGGEIYFDDVLIRRDGRFVLAELEGLNPENLT